MRGPKPDGCRTIWVGWMERKPEEQEVVDFFKGCGTVTEVRISAKNIRGYFCHVAFEETTGVDQAVKMVGHEMCGAKISIDFAYMDKVATNPRLEAEAPSSRRYRPKSVKPPNGHTLWVGDIPMEVTEQDLIDMFEENCGKIEMICLQVNQLRNGQFGHIKFLETEAVDKAAEKAGTLIRGVPLRLDFAEDKPLSAYRVGKDRGEPESAKPEGCRTIWIGGLPGEATEEMITSLFERCGTIKEVRLDRSKQKGALFCHVEYEDTSAVDKAVRLSGERLSGSRIRVDYAENRKNDKAGPPGTPGKGVGVPPPGDPNMLPPPPGHGGVVIPPPGGPFGPPPGYPGMPPGMPPWLGPPGMFMPPPGAPWDPRGPPVWDPRGPPPWDPRGPPQWDPRGPPPPWDPRGPPPPGFGLPPGPPGSEMPPRGPPGAPDGVRAPMPALPPPPGGPPPRGDAPPPPPGDAGSGNFHIVRPSGPSSSAPSGETPAGDAPSSAPSDQQPKEGDAPAKGDAPPPGKGDAPPSDAPPPGAPPPAPGAPPPGAPPPGEWPARGPPQSYMPAARPPPDYYQRPPDPYWGAYYPPRPGEPPPRGPPPGYPPWGPPPPGDPYGYPPMPPHPDPRFAEYYGAYGAPQNGAPPSAQPQGAYTYPSQPPDAAQQAAPGPQKAKKRKGGGSRSRSGSSYSYSVSYSGSYSSSPERKKSRSRSRGR